MKDIYIEKANKIMQEITSKTTMTQHGSLPYLFLGSRKSTASIWIKIGRNFEKWFKYIVYDCGLTPLPDGIIKNVIGNKSKDIDLLFMNEVDKIIYYRELKSNLELDTEKLKATYDKINKISEFLKKTYPTFKLDVSLFIWAVYSESDLPKKYNSKIKECNQNGVSVSFPSDLFELINADICQLSYEDLFKNLGNTYLS
jgi:hypothetical protein